MRLRPAFIGFFEIKAHGQSSGTTVVKEKVAKVAGKPFVDLHKEIYQNFFIKLRGLNMRRMRKLLGVLLLVSAASLGAPQAFADGNDPGGIEMPGKTTKAGPGGIEMPGMCEPGGGIEMPGLCTTISIILSTLI